MTSWLFYELGAWFALSKEYSRLELPVSRSFVFIFVMKNLIIEYIIIDQIELCFNGDLNFNSQWKWPKLDSAFNSSHIENFDVCYVT